MNRQYDASQRSCRGGQHHDFRVVTLTRGLEHPWELVFLPDGGLLWLEPK